MSVPEGIERDYSLARLTTVRAGGAADFFARAASEERLVELLAWAEREGLAVGVVGSGSNLLVADDGFRGLVLKLDGDLAAIERRDERIVCGGGARLPSAAAKAAGWGLSGLEFGINIPGTVGGAVKMNANAYGGELGADPRVGDVCTRGRRERREPGDLGFGYRSSNLAPGEVVSRASFLLEPGDPDAIKADAGEHAEARAARPSPRGSRPSARPSRTRPTTRAARGPHRGPAARGGRLPRPGRRRRAVLRQARELRRELRRRDDRRRARADGGGPPPRARALRRRRSSPRSRSWARSSGPRPGTSVRATDGFAIRDGSAPAPRPAARNRVRARAPAARRAA